MTDNRMIGNRGNQAQLSSTSTDTQSEQVRSMPGSSQTELERNNSLTPPTDLQCKSLGGDNPRLGSGGSSQGNTGILRSGSIRVEQDINPSQPNDSASQNMIDGRRGSNESVGSAAVGSGYDTLLARKLAEASVTDYQSADAIDKVAIFIALSTSC